MLVVLLVIMIAAGGYLFRALSLLICVLAVHETAAAVMKKSDAFLLSPVYLAACISILCIGQISSKYLAVIWIIALICIVTVTVCRSIDVSDALHVVFLCVYPTSFLLSFVYGFFCLPREHALPFVMLTAGGPSVCDTFAYFGGLRFGKRKLCPSISPHKTVAGSVFAVFGGLLSGFLVFVFQRFRNGSADILFFLAAGLLIGVFSQIGDLFASRIKRWAGIKDFSELIPGHGGIMDRIDSTLLTSAVTLVVFLLFT